MSAFLLAIETSTEFCSVALATLAAPTKILLQHEHTGARSSLRTLPLVQQLLDTAQITLKELSAIAIGAGPGSFTGLRNACALAQGLAFGLDVPVIAVDNLMACAEFARQTAGHQRVLVALDARMGEAYWAEYHYIEDSGQGHWQIISAPRLSKPAEIVMQQQNDCLAGNAATIFPDSFKQSALPQLVEAMPRADYIAHLAAKSFDAGQAVSPELLLPVYLRNKVALTIAERRLA